MSHKRNASLKVGDRVVHKINNRNGVVSEVEQISYTKEIIWVVWNDKHENGHKRRDLINLDRKI